MSKPRALHGMTTVGVFLDGRPEFELFGPILLELAKRGGVMFRVFLTSGLARREPDVVRLLKGYGIDPIIRPNKWMKSWLFYRRLVGTFDLLLTAGEPSRDITSHGPRLRFLAKSGVPMFYFQHGVIQGGINIATIEPPPWSFYACRIYLFQEPLANRALFSSGELPKIKISGFLKQVLLPRKSPSNKASELIKNRAGIILICHSFRWGGGRFSNEAMTKLSAMIRHAASELPDYLFIVRPHRGKTRKVDRLFETELCEGFNNIVFARQHFGAFGGMSLSDLTVYCSAVISTPSTALLDAAYDGCPVAVFNCDHEVFDDIPQVYSNADFVSFCQTPSTRGRDIIIERYGDIMENLNVVCSDIENYQSNEYYNCS